MDPRGPTSDIRGASNFGHQKQGNLQLGAVGLDEQWHRSASKRPGGATILERSWPKVEVVEMLNGGLRKDLIQRWN